VHISQLADRYVKDPAEVVRVGDKLQVRVLEVDLERRRISLTARSGERPPVPAKREGERGPAEKGERRGGSTKGKEQQRPPREKPRVFTNNPFAELLKQK